jgi:glycosyltransferase involved in cell wall biosynthesis
MVKVSVVILTYNEEVHIERVLDNAVEWADEVFVVDSYSTDRTQELAIKKNAKVVLHKFQNYSLQREWCLRELPFKNSWVLFLDADEMLSERLKIEIERHCLLESNINGYYICRKFYWMEKWLRHGGYYPIWLLRLMRHKKARCNERVINEHFEVEGATSRIKGDILHKDLKPLSDWIQKHNRYSDLEAIELIKSMDGVNSDTMAKFWSAQAERKRWIRQKLWNTLLPPLLRPFFYFIYRYIFKFGFLDGKAGFTYHLLQGFWFPLVIDIKFLELINARKRLLK